MAVPAGAGHARHQPLRPGDRRGHHQGAGAGAAPTARMAGWARRFRIAIQGDEPAHEAAVHLAPLPRARPGGGASSGGRRLGDAPAKGRRRAASSSAASKSPRRASRSSSSATSSAPTPAATANIAAASAPFSTCGGDRPSRPSATRRATACATPPYGILGGKDGLPAPLRAAVAGRATRVLKTKEVGIADPPGDRLRHRVRRAAAAGATPAQRRDRAPPRRRRRNGVVTQQRTRASRRSAAGADMYRIGIDVGGTFTDLVAVDERGPRTHRQVRLDAARPLDRRDRRARRSWPPSSAPIARALLGADRAHRARHHGGDQRAARAQGRAGRPADHRRPPRRHRDARGAQGRPLQPPHAAARAAGAARPPARRARAHALRRHASRPRSTARSLEAAIAALAKARRRGGRRLLPARLPRPAPRAGDRDARWRGAARRLRLAVVRGAAADQGVRAGLDDGRQRLRRARRWRATWRGSRARLASARLPRRRADHAVARRRGADRASRRGWPRAPCCRARRAASPAAATARGCSARAT